MLKTRPGSSSARELAGSEPRQLLAIAGQNGPAALLCERSVAVCLTGDPKPREASIIEGRAASTASRDICGGNRRLQREGIQPIQNRP